MLSDRRQGLKAWEVLPGMRLAKSKVGMTRIDEVRRVTQEEIMKTYSYEALTRDDSVVKGSMESGNERLVIDQIQGMGYYPLKISGADEGANLFSIFKVFENKVREKDIMSLSYQLSVLFEAGFPLDRSLLYHGGTNREKKSSRKSSRNSSPAFVPANQFSGCPLNVS